MESGSKKILEQLYHQPPKKIHFIPHGIHPIIFQDSSSTKPKLHLEKRTVLSTFGMLSRVKGIEFVIHALPKVTQQHPDLLYLVLGQTHPHVRSTEGETYRHELDRKSTRLNSSHQIISY